MKDAVLLQIGDKLFFDVVVVVTVVQSAGSTEEVDIGAAVLIRHGRTLGVFEHGGEMTAVGSHIGFILFKNAAFH
jgi:hypothetical protein